MKQQFIATKEVHNSLRMSRGTDQPNPGNVLGLGATGTGPTPVQTTPENKTDKR